MLLRFYYGSLPFLSTDFAFNFLFSIAMRASAIAFALGATFSISATFAFTITAHVLRPYVVYKMYHFTQCYNGTILFTSEPRILRIY